MLKRNIGIILVLLITLVVYFPVFFCHFVGDDYGALCKLVTSKSLTQVFEPYWGRAYLRPLSWAPFLLGYALAGLPMPPDPAWQAGSFLPAYHFLSIAFHLATVFLVYLVALFVLRSRIYGALAAFIFAIHPANSEVICWVSTFADTAFSFFSLLSLILFAKFYLKDNKRYALLYYSGSLLSFILALCAKEIAFCLPLLIILALLFLRHRGWLPKENQKRFSWAAYFLIDILYLALRKLFMSSYVFSPMGRRNLILEAPEQLYKIAYYLRDLIFLVDSELLKRFVYQHSLLFPAIVLAVSIFSLSVCVIVARRRKNPALVFLLGWIIITLLIPFLGAYSPARRHLYLSLAGYSIFLVSAVSLLKKKYISVSLLLCLAALQIWTSLGRNNLYLFAGQVVQNGLCELKKELPKVEPESIIYLVGLPGMAKSTPAFWAVATAKVKFIYKDKNQPVVCLSVIAFTEKGIQDTDLCFLDDFTLVQSMETGPEEFIRLPVGEYRQKDGKWITFLNSNTRFKVLERDEFGNVKKVMFRLNPSFLKGKKIYFVGVKDGKISILRSMRIS